jgi:hypothetical protein
MIRAIRVFLGWAALTAAVITAVLVIRDNPHGAAQMARDVSSRAGTFASAAASQLPQGRPQPSPGPVRTQP